MRLLELYTSVQGEGPNVGRPTTFVRFAGCNLRCPGWPCDTPHAIFPEQWRPVAQIVSPEVIISRVKARYPKHVCITGGEPLIQRKADLSRVVNTLLHEGYTIDVFTNGSVPLEATGILRTGVTIIMDWKLPGSGEGDSFLRVRTRNRLLLRTNDAVKFVITNKSDLKAAVHLMQSWGPTAHRVYIAPAWGKIPPRRLVQFIEEYSLSDVLLNLQIHKYIWKPARKGV